MLFLFQQYQEVILTLLKKTSQEESYYIPRHFLPFGQADLTASASLRSICSTLVRQHGPTPRICSKLGS